MADFSCPVLFNMACLLHTWLWLLCFRDRCGSCALMSDLAVSFHTDIGMLQGCACVCCAACAAAAPACTRCTHSRRFNHQVDASLGDCNQPHNHIQKSRVVLHGMRFPTSNAPGCPQAYAWTGSSQQLQLLPCHRMHQTKTSLARHKQAAAVDQHPQQEYHVVKVHKL